MQRRAGFPNGYFAKWKEDENWGAIIIIKEEKIKFLFTKAYIIIKEKKERKMAQWRNWKALFSPKRRVGSQPFGGL